MISLRSFLTSSTNYTILKSITSSHNAIRKYDTLAVTTVAPHVTHVQLNRPEKRNAMNNTLWRELAECFNALSEDKQCRAIVLSGSGKIFSAGLDLSDMQGLASMTQSDEDLARRCRNMYNLIRTYQNSLSSLEKCLKPVISCVHSACVGAGTNMVCAADIRYCTLDAYFQIKEVDIGIAADVGALQRMPKIVGNESLVRELAFTAREMHADEALKVGFVNRIFEDKNSMLDAGFELAKNIASKSPVAVQATKVQLIYARDHGVEESLKYQAVWNMSLLQGEDLMKSAMAHIQKSKAEFSDY